MAKTGTSEIYMIIIKDTYEQYVGKTNCGIKHRIKNHLKENLLVDNKMRAHGYDVVVLEKCPIELEAEREIYYIDQFNTIHDRNVGGLNLTIGGEGFIQLSEEVAAKKLEILRSPEMRKLQSDIAKASKSDPEYIRKFTEAVTSPEYRATQSENQKKLWKDEIFRKTQGDAISIGWTKKVRDKQSEYRVALWKDPECRAKNIAGLKKAWQTPETRFKHAEAIRQRRLRKTIAQGFKLLEEIGGTR